MSQTNATTGVASSGNTVGFSRGRKTTGEQVLGKEEKLGELVYKFNTKDQADMYLRTTEAIADFVGVEYGRDMRMLVKHGTEKTFTEPRIPRSDDTTPGLMEKYKTELRIFHRDKKEFQDNKAKVFVIILGQCTHNVKSKLENELGYATLEMNDDVVGLLRQLKQMAFASGGVQHPFWTLQIVMRRLLAINQGPRESVTNYYRRFVSTTEVIEEQWGKFYPEKLAVSTSDADKNIARDKYLSMIFLAGADKARFGTLIENLNNSYLAGNDQYPVSLDGTLTLLSHYQDHRGGEHMDDDKNVSRETSFAQRKPRKEQQLARIRCWNCNEYGHYQSDCPQKKKMHGTQMSEVEEDENEEGTASARSRQDGTASTRSRPRVQWSG